MNYKKIVFLVTLYFGYINADTVSDLYKKYPQIKKAAYKIYPTRQETMDTLFEKKDENLELLLYFTMQNIRNLDSRKVSFELTNDLLSLSAEKNPTQSNFG